MCSGLPQFCGDQPHAAFVLRQTKIAQLFSNGFAGHLGSMLAASGIFQVVFPGALAKAMRITRTESHRISNRASFNACFTAKSKGANVVKQWDATLDGRTRHSYRIVDSEIAELEERFSNGLLYPGDTSGPAAEVVNCRCALLQRAKWALDEDELDRLQERAKFFGLDKNDSFEEFKTKYLQVIDNNGNYNYNNDKLFKVNRKKSNFGAFSNLKIPMQKKEVLKISKKYNIDTTDITFKIQRSEDLIGSIYFGSADYNDIGRIDLMPNAFVDEIKLAKTIVHEICQVEQLRKYVKNYVQSHLVEMEKEAYKFEEEFFMKKV